jgi:hypothetical protein
MNEAPSMLSWEFHSAFFPRLLWSRLVPKKKTGEGTSFSSNMELTVALFVCLILLALGAPMAVRHNSLVGWIIGGAGMAGILFIFISSVVAQRGTRPTYDGFLIGIFFFFVFLGITAGLFWGSINHYSHGVETIAAALGLLAGYITGIFGGLWAQYLGWVSGLLNGLAGLGIIGMVIVDLVLLFG